MADTCAAWSFGEWGTQCSGASLDRACARYRATAAAGPRDLPATWLALAGGKPAGMISLKGDDHPDLMDLGPWLASLYVHPWYRGAGVATRLMAHLECQARDVFKFERLYLFTGNAQGLYEKRGWKALRAVRDPARADRQDMLMSKELH